MPAAAPVRRRIFSDCGFYVVKPKISLFPSKSRVEISELFQSKQCENSKNKPDNIQNTSSGLVDLIGFEPTTPTMRM